MERIVIRPYDIKQLDSKVKPLGNRLDLFFDYVKSDFTTMIYYDEKNRANVYYSKCKSRTLSDEVKAKFPDYHNKLDAMIDSCTVDLISKYLNMPDINFKQVVEVEYIPELRGLNFKTAGYIIGNACARQVYVEELDSDLTYIASNGAYTIPSDVVKVIAARYLYKDIQDSNSLGYLYYNKSRPIKDIRGEDVKVADVNERRFGAMNTVRSISNLVRNFTSFVPIGFKWSVYQPLWMQNEKFLDRLQYKTKLGLDLVEIPNLTIDGTTIQDFDSVTYYTKEKRLHQVLGVKFVKHNYRFYNELIAGLFTEGKSYTAATSIAISKVERGKFITGLEYDALADSDKDSYELSTDEKVSRIAASKLIKGYWYTMNSSVADIPSVIADAVSRFNWDELYSDNMEAIRTSKELFNYVN